MKSSVDFAGFDSLMKTIRDIGGDVDEAATEALIRVHEEVTEGIEQAMEGHKFNGKKVNWNHTGQTKKSLRKEAKVERSGNIVSVETGFEWPTAAKYLAYDRGTPRKMKASPGLRNALNSKKLYERAIEIQEQALADYIAEKMRKG